MTYIQITSNSGQLSAYFQRIARQLPEVLDEAVYQSGLDVLQMWYAVEATWTTKSEFELQHEGTGRWGIKTDDPRVGWIDKGTPPHVIAARNAPYLVFSWPSKAKTKPNVISSFAGSRGNRWARKKSVYHPGIAPRNFRRIIAQRAQAPTANRLRAALKQATYGPGAGL